MKVVLSIDAVHWPLTGIGRYTSELARNLPSVEPALDLRLLAGERLVNTLTLPQEASRGAGRKHWALELRKLVQRSPLVASLARQSQASRQAKLLRNFEDAVLHGPNFYLPKFNGRSVVTIHDLSVFLWAHCHPKGRVKVLQKEIASSVRRANMVLTDSEYTRSEVAAFFNIPDERIRSVSLGSSAEFTPRAAGELAPVLAPLGLQPNGYCLYAGTIEPRKNVDALLDVYQSLPHRTRQRWPLVLCGYEGWQSAALHDRIRRAECEGWAKYLGFVAPDQLPLIYAGARLFAFPSFYEGFGLPVLEAMASGVPVVCSDSSSLPEVLGGAGAMCPPEDRDEFLRLVVRGLEDEQWQAAARARGLGRAASFSWRRCVSETLEVYRAAAD